MKQTIQLFKPKGDIRTPDHIQVETMFSAGQEYTLPYYIHTHRHKGNGFVSAFQPGGYPAFSQFVVRGLSAYLQNSTPVILVELESLDPQFFCHYPAERKILLTEEMLLKLLSQTPAPKPDQP